MSDLMKTILRLAVVIALLFVCRPLLAFQIGEALDFTKAEMKDSSVGTLRCADP